MMWLSDRLGVLAGRSWRQRPAVSFRELGEYGGLGNQLWEIAATLGIARRQRSAARFNSWAYRDHFSVPACCFDPPVGEEVDAVSIAMHIAEPFRHYLQDYSLFRRFEDDVRRYFAPAPATRLRFEERFGELLSLPNKTALHVRRGDYLKWPTHHPLPPLDYYRRAVDLIGESSILVFSDDIGWCQQNLEWAHPVSFIDGNFDHEDLLLMARCDHHILANSSFSWWGTFLSNDKRPIYPSQWYGSTFLDLGIDQSLMLPKEWVGINV